MKPGTNEELVAEALENLAKAQKMTIKQLNKLANDHDDTKKDQHAIIAKLHTLQKDVSASIKAIIKAEQEKSEARLKSLEEAQNKLFMAVGNLSATNSETNQRLDDIDIPGKLELALTKSAFIKLGKEKGWL
jgi:hypothetical protein